MRSLRLPVALLLAMLAVALSTPGADARPRAAFPSLSLGSRGVNVEALQHLLRERGSFLVVSGHFEAVTQASVGEFQAEHDLTADGVVDEPVWRELVPSVAEGAQGDAVLAVQKLLNAKRRLDLTLTGNFDSATMAAVAAFQRHVGLPRSGTVETETWRELLAHYVHPEFAGSPMCRYHSGNGAAAHWGTAETVGYLTAAVELFHERTGLRVSVGELSFEHGGNIDGHATHEIGLDVDLGVIREDGRHCRILGTGYRSARYDRALTRELIRALYETAPNHVRLIYFNDPELVARGVVERYPNHDDHLHVRYCEVGHDLTRYQCGAVRFDVSAIEAPTMPAAAPTNVHDPADYRY